MLTLHLIGWVASSSANVFVANHDTERVLSLLTIPSSKVSLTDTPFPRLEWQFPQLPLSQQHLHSFARLPFVRSYYLFVEFLV